MAAKKTNHGGRRKGAGRPKDTEARRNRVAVMFNDREYQTILGLAEKKGLPVATVAYRLIAKRLK